MRKFLLIVGCGLILVSPVVGIVPGPGGIFVFAAGVGLMLRTSTKAKRVYVRAAKQWPKLGEWTDWGLRRHSARRRRERATAA